MATRNSVTAQELIGQPNNLRRHVVLLGAGASRASFPEGDRAGKPLPVMNDLIEKLELRKFFEEANLIIGEETNFEILYGQLLSNPEFLPIARSLEARIDKYFSGLSLPDHVTVYDRLLLSLRPTDAVFTFNWDPFLFDAYKRNRSAVSLPEIFFLHGNVRIGACSAHEVWGGRDTYCPQCYQRFSAVPLLYPIEQKNYADHWYIRDAWECAKSWFNDAFTITIFGYGAPDSDNMAVQLLKTAWFGESQREFEHVQIIDTAPLACLQGRWSAFTPTAHLHPVSCFEDSRIARWPRRSVESLSHSMSQALACEEFPLPETGTISELQKYAANIARHENASPSK